MRTEGFYVNEKYCGRASAIKSIKNCSNIVFRLGDTAINIMCLLYHHSVHSTRAYLPNHVVSPTTVILVRSLTLKITRFPNRLLQRYMYTMWISIIILGHVHILDKRKGTFLANFMQ